MDPAAETEQPPPPCTLDKFHISREYGFLLPDPQTELPAPYRPWMDLARSLPDLIATRQLRAHVHQAPQLSAAQLHGHRDLRLAHLVLGFITAGYVWQDGEEGPAKVLPQNLAVPFWEVSRRLGLPPILLHADLVLANWRRRDRAGPLELRNLDPIVWLPGGESLRGFVLVTMLVEKVAVPGLQAIAEAAPAIRQPNGETLLRALAQLATALGAMTEALMQMHDHVDPDTFYTAIRLFLSGWRDNPAMPAGLLYEGVWELPQAYSGGSAAQSTVLHAFDAFLGVRHHEESSAFLHRMRDYMPPCHRAFVEAIEALPPLRELVLSSGNEALRRAYNGCVTALAAFRTRHIAVATRYVVTAAATKRSRGSPGTGPLLEAPSGPEQRGTGGSPVLHFLKSVRDTTREALLNV
ncbi:PREDICTED: indoleamine 2,3-dioxygenase 2 [Gavialis gangeticus]|uniref:indoleamine 2,3-dioxygenase 2 n=1 Tax=Gavialis gangeticus TaxID=94835 RepID=UPI00092FB383|nr:PREDICTED: indoleamine 2,3-dioxygenase 2 [Gavialis gangeticus]